MKDHDPEELVNKINRLAEESLAQGITVNASSSEEYREIPEQYEIKIGLQFVIPSLDSKAKYLIKRENKYFKSMRLWNKRTIAEMTLTGEGKNIAFSLYIPEQPEDSLPRHLQNIWDATINGTTYSTSIIYPVVDEKAKAVIRQCHSITRSYLDSQIPEVMTLALSKIAPRQKGIDALLKELDMCQKR